MENMLIMIKTIHYRKSYRVYGSRNQGFGIEVAWKYSSGKEEKAKSPPIFISFQQAEKIARKLALEDVHPVHLLDVIQDLYIDKISQWKNQEIKSVAGVIF